jgi:type II secretory pathway pseudopilin PulG
MTGEATKRRSDEATKGFTLVEMVIVIGIIILLAALTLSVSVAVVEGSEVRQTENTIRLLTAAIQEWEAQADRRVTYGSGTGFDINDQDYTDEESVTAKLLSIIGRPASVKQILAQINPEFVEQITGWDPNDSSNVSLKCADAWDGVIIAVHPGRLWEQGSDPDNRRDVDGTFRTNIEMVRGVAANRQICFVSAGPNGTFGNLDPESPEYDPEPADDNLYSYEPAEISAP